MATWQKVITSGSAAALSSVTLDTDLEVAHGGTGASTFTDGGILFGNGTDAIQASAVLAAGEILIGDGTTEPTILDVGSAAGIQVLDTISTGVWQGTAIASAYLDAQTAHLDTDQTFTGNKKFSAPITGSSYSGSATSTGSFGRIEGSIGATVEVSKNLDVAANNSNNETVYPLFVDGATGTQRPETDTGLFYNPSTGLLTTTDITATIGASAQSSGRFTTVQATGITDAGTSSISYSDINGGEIDGAVIGGNSAAAGTFAALVGTSLSVGDGNITNVGDINADSISVDAAAAGLNIDFSGGDTGTNKITLQDDLADALNILEGSNSYIKFVSQDNALYNIVVDVPIQFTAGNSVDINAGSIDGATIGANTAAAGTFTTGTFSGNVSIAGDLSLTGGATITNVTSSNLTIGDAFAFFATGSAGSNIDSGFIVQSGSVDLSGSALYHDTDDERWAVAKSVSATTLAVTPLEYVMTVYDATSGGNNQPAPPAATGSYGVGEMWIDNTSAPNEGIWIRTA